MYTNYVFYRRANSHTQFVGQQNLDENPKPSGSEQKPMASVQVDAWSDTEHAMVTRNTRPSSVNAKPQQQQPKRWLCERRLGRCSDLTIEKTSAVFCLPIIQSKVDEWRRQVEVETMCYVVSFAHGLFFSAFRSNDKRTEGNFCSWRLTPYAWLVTVIPAFDRRISFNCNRLMTFITTISSNVNHRIEHWLK